MMAFQMMVKSVLGLMVGMVVGAMLVGVLAFATAGPMGVISGMVLGAMAGSLLGAGASFWRSVSAPQRAVQRQSAYQYGTAQRRAVHVAAGGN